MAMSEPNFSVFDVKQLAELYDILSTLKSVLLAIQCQPRCETSTLGSFVEDEGRRYGQAPLPRSSMAVRLLRARRRPIRAVEPLTRERARP
ncbi:hypothetical protein Mnod_3986 [Methylobacterium nodulans ORS 2060]|uniref:Uncharacterized protein n=1 Tax=Methylobacterium nodulans (strain LMG 21967 / CNCM I-2342 / ORS 2060) TaxID=460265 RepID=B8ITF8_METNO|nr:hypothetical protein Mnod_3986 [Methylobacterium nodulans ORS 2060]